MYVASITSKQKIFHTADCSHAKSIKEDHRIYFQTAEEAIQKGYRRCQDCCEIGSYYKKERNEILSYCFQNGISAGINREDGFLDVVTPYSSWKIIVNGRKHGRYLYHRNTIETESPGALLPGYHPQHVLRNTLIGYLRYIVEHDSYRRSHPLLIQKPKKDWRECHYRKGSKKYKNQQNRLKRMERRESIKRVDELLQSLEVRGI